MAKLIQKKYSSIRSANLGVAPELKATPKAEIGQKMIAEMEKKENKIMFKGKSKNKNKKGKSQESALESKGKRRRRAKGARRSPGRRLHGKSCGARELEGQKPKEPRPEIDFERKEQTTHSCPLQKKYSRAGNIFGATDKKAKAKHEQNLNKRSFYQFQTEEKNSVQELSLWGTPRQSSRRSQCTFKSQDTTKNSKRVRRRTGFEITDRIYSGSPDFCGLQGDLPFAKKMNFRSRGPKASEPEKKAALANLTCKRLKQRIKRISVSNFSDKDFRIKIRKIILENHNRSDQST